MCICTFEQFFEKYLRCKNLDYANYENTDVIYYMLSWLIKNVISYYEIRQKILACRNIIVNK